MLQANLKVVGGRHHGKMIPLATKKFLIGREQDCHLRPNSELISRHHCVFAVDDFSVRVRDLGSTNGTFVNDERVRGEAALQSGDRIRVGKLDFELVIGEPVAATAPPRSGDSSQLLPPVPGDLATAETAPLAAGDTSFEIPVPPLPEDTGSSINQPDSMTPVPAAPIAPAAPSLGDSATAWQSPAAQSYGSGAPGYAPEAYPSMGMPYPQAPYQMGYPYMPPGMGYQPHFSYPQMPMGYPGMYPQMGGYAPPAQAYPPQPTATPEPQEEEAESAPSVRLPDPKTTGAKPPEPPAPKPAEPVATEEATGDGSTKEPEKKAPEVKPSQKAADILKNYPQRRPV